MVVALKIMYEKTVTSFIIDIFMPKEMYLGLHVKWYSYDQLTVTKIQIHQYTVVTLLNTILSRSVY